MKNILSIVLLFVAISAGAQETYTNAEMVSEDLSGTARYIGMGGAMEALGADISTIGTNPAGIGMFRRSTVALSASVLSQTDAGSYRYGDATKTSFDQAGFVWSTRLRHNRYFNIGFNFKKARNFNNVTSVAGALGGASQNKNAYMNLMDAGSLYGNTVSQLDALYYETFTHGSNGNLYYNDGTKFTHDFSAEGYVGEYDVNISGNVSNRIYLGITFGFNDVNYRSHSSYSENLVNADNASIGSVTVNDHRTIDGTGFNVKAGIIFFPIEDSAFRVGLSIATPTWYDLTSCSWTSLDNNTSVSGDATDRGVEEYGEYDYRVYTPWKFGVSLGHTIGTTLAIGASYEYANYSSMSNRIIGDYDYDYSYYGNSVKDYEMNEHTQRTLKGVSTLKLGVEFKATKDLAVRAGYNFVSAMYRGDGYRDCTVNSLGTYYSSRSDYTNWKATNRITLGAGYTIGHFGIDIAYQYNVTSGTYYPFMSSEATYTYGDGTQETVYNYVDGVKVKNKRNQFTATLSYKF
ncbi:MAG: outer membrane protein transport protein [Prevotella sp.]|nr:outer membrane protein transport protein [Prevotella sp.]